VSRSQRSLMGGRPRSAGGTCRGFDGKDDPRGDPQGLATGDWRQSGNGEPGTEAPRSLGSRFPNPGRAWGAPPIPYSRFPIPDNASTTSAALAYLAAGSFASRRSSTTPTSGGNPSRFFVMGTGVSVSTIYPGEVQTSLHSEATQLPDWRNSKEAIPPEQVAEATAEEAPAPEEAAAEEAPVAESSSEPAEGSVEDAPAEGAETPEQPVAEAEGVSSEEPAEGASEDEKAE